MDDASRQRVRALAAVALGLLSVVGWGAFESRPSDPAVAPVSSARIHINQADPATLCLLPRIGPALAQRIVDARREAPFADADDLQRVRGIGPKTVERLRPWVRF